MNKNLSLKLITVILLFPVILIFCNTQKQEPAYNTWQTAHGNSEGNHYSSLTQIDTSNISQLQVAWEFHTGDADTAAHSQIQCNPIIINGVIYFTSPTLKVFAVDAATGKEIWMFSPYDAVKEGRLKYFNLNSNRGVAYWSDGKDDNRIFYAVGQYMICLNATTGKFVNSFGDSGKVDLHDGLEMDDVKDLYVTQTSPPSVYKNLIIAGTRVSEGMDAAPGDIRAYDARTGKIAWLFHTIPHPGEAGYETWEDPDAWKYTGGANNWMGMTIDQNRGITFIPVGSASMDFYGGKRKGSNLFADCLLALDAATGKEKWHFQYLHHDTWDYDPSSAPVLLTVVQDGKRIDAVAQTTKTGFVFIFNRDNGQPLFPVVETPVDTITGLMGEKLYPTQPMPQKPAPQIRQSFSINEVNPYLPKKEYDSVVKLLKTVHAGHIFMPQSKEGTIVFPGFDGGAEYGGPAVDPETGILYSNNNEMAWIMKMFDAQSPKNTMTFKNAGPKLYRQNCMSCHGADKNGGGNYPSIANISKKLNKEQFINFINAGRRMMPSFQHLSEMDKEAIAYYVLNLTSEQNRKFETKLSAADSFRLVPYEFSGYNKFYTKSGLPCLSPPWGVLNAIDMNTGEYVWKNIFGEDEYPGAPPNSGCENYGGPVVTKGGLLFIGAAKDGMFRVYNKRNGKLLWQTKLPAAAFATPATYEVNGRQFIVIACGGGKLGTQSGDSYVAFAIKPGNPNP